MQIILLFCLVSSRLYTVPTQDITLLWLYNRLSGDRENQTKGIIYECELIGCLVANSNWNIFSHSDVHCADAEWFDSLSQGRHPSRPWISHGVQNETVKCAWQGHSHDKNRWKVESEASLRVHEIIALANAWLTMKHYDYGHDDYAKP